jgi:hypothetical protein
VRGSTLAGTVLLALLGGAAAARAADVETGWRERVTLILSERLRGELVDWFEPEPGAAAAGAERYAFFASQLRVGARVLLPQAELNVVMQDTRLAALPDDASLPPPVGNLGPGAIYFAHTHDTSQGEPFLKQATVTLRRAGVTATVGRFDVKDGLETTPADATLATLKQTRIAERLVGPFDFTHVTRSFDGGRVAWDHGAWNLTGLATRPTQGGFEVSANRELDAALAGVAATLRRLPHAPPIDARVFWLYYQDGRDAPLKVDNRPLDVRAADHDRIVVHSVGSHLLAALDAGPGVVDLLGWGVVQTGDWGMLDHRAWAWALEAGYQLPRLPAAPWLRIGWNRSAGDDDPADDDHRTFFQVLPTPRIYAQLPFYNLMNSDDVFASLTLRPHRRVTLRFDWHRLRLTEGRDLWYSGGGATSNTVFGFAGIPAGGHRALAEVADASLNVTLPWRLRFGAYYGHAFGASVVGETFAGRGADYGFVELAFKY